MRPYLLALALVAFAFPAGAQITAGPFGPFAMVDDNGKLVGGILPTSRATGHSVAVALSGRGTAVIKGHRWSRLGVKLEVLRANRRNRNDNLDEIEGPLSPKLRVTLVNVSEMPLSVVNPGQDCGFELTAVIGSRQAYQNVDRSCQAVQPSDGDVILLEPEAAYSVELDLSEARWHVKTGNKVSEIGRLDRFERFRITYRAPDRAALQGLTAPEAVWPGYLPTRAFDAFGRID